MQFDTQIGSEQNPVGSAATRANIRDFIKEQNAKRSRKQKLRAELLGIKYQMQDYADQAELDEKEFKTLETFVKAYLSVLNITFKEFAINIDSSDGNLKKYISGERKFNTDLALKFGHFFHTPPELWIQINVKNELQELKREKRKLSQYKKYDYEKLV